MDMTMIKFNNNTRSIFEMFKLLEPLDAFLVAAVELVDPLVEVLVAAIELADSLFAVLVELL